MQQSRLIYGALLTGGLLMLASCTDDKYDLSDIDTTTAIKINDLTIPVRLNSITLDNVLNIEDSDILFKVEGNNGTYYAIQKGGEFDADPIFIKMLDAVSETTAPTLTLPVSGNKVEKVTGRFSYLINNVDESLQSLSYFGLYSNNYMEIDLNVSPSNANLSNVELAIPETFTALYKGETYTGGIVPVTLSNGSLDEPIYITEMLFEPALIPSSSRQLDIAGEIGINSATIGGNVNNISVKFTMSPFTVNVVSGSINYAVQAPEIAPVDLSGLPDFLTEGETNLILQNPQLYLNLGYVNGANYVTELSIIPQGLNTKPIEDLALTFTESIVIAPDTEDLGLHLYDAPTLVEAEDLKYILSGDGLPESIDFSLENTYVRGEITDLVLGEDKYISGGYMFFTPLAFDNGSQIIYQKAETDFFGDDMEDVKVNRFRVESDITSELPVDITITLYPLDKDGNKIQGKNGIVSTSSTVAQGTSHLDLHISEEFQGLDGVEYEVKAENMAGVSLSPDQKITLNNIRATISGEYVTKL